MIFAVEKRKEKFIKKKKKWKAFPISSINALKFIQTRE